jgi:signal transduction histidine kinase
MLKRSSLRSILMMVGIMVFAFGLVSASDAPTKDDAKALVKEAVKFAKANGKEKFFDEVRNPKGKFHFQEGTKKGLYIFVYDEKGVVLAHGVRLELTGKNRWNDKDPDGKYWIREWTELVQKSGSGWIKYKEFNPAAGNKIMDKWSFVELVDGMVIGCGVYA